MSAKLSAWRRGAALLLISGCTGVLGLDDYTDALELACRCAAEDAGLTEACVALAEQRFAAADEQVVTAWLGGFAACAGCKTMQACWSNPPFCSAFDAACVASEQCCAHSDDTFVGCVGGSCKACVDCANYALGPDLWPTNLPLCSDVPEQARACAEACPIDVLCRKSCLQDHCF